MDYSETDRDPAPAGSEAVSVSTSQGEEPQACPEPGSPVTRRSLQQRFEESSVGVWVISAIIVVIFVIICVLLEPVPTAMECERKRNAIGAQITDWRLNAR